MITGINSVGSTDLGCFIFEILEHTFILLPGLVCMEPGEGECVHRCGCTFNVIAARNVGHFIMYSTHCSSYYRLKTHVPRGCTHHKKQAYVCSLGACIRTCMDTPSTWQLWVWLQITLQWWEMVMNLYMPTKPYLQGQDWHVHTRLSYKTTHILAPPRGILAYYYQVISATIDWVIMPAISLYIILYDRPWLDQWNTSYIVDRPWLNQSNTCYIVDIPWLDQWNTCYIVDRPWLNQWNTCYIVDRPWLDHWNTCYIVDRPWLD